LDVQAERAAANAYEDEQFSHATISNVARQGLTPLSSSGV